MVAARLAAILAVGPQIAIWNSSARWALAGTCRLSEQSPRGTIARLRIHGTTRRQVWTHFLEVEQPALQPLAREGFPPTLFSEGYTLEHSRGKVRLSRIFGEELGEIVRSLRAANPALWAEASVRLAG